MKGPKRVLFGVSVLVATTLVVSSSSTIAAEVRPRALVSLGGRVDPGETTELIKVGGSASQPFIVPRGNVLVLTDIIISPQSFPTTGEYLWQVSSSPQVFTSSLVVTSSSSDASSFQVHLTTGMAFQARSAVRFGLVFGTNAVNISALGYLEGASGGEDEDDD